MESKRYYWLRFYTDFFDSKRIKKLRKMKRGDTLLIIYLKMQLKALTKGGMLEYTGIEDDPAEEIALDLDESPKDVQNVIDFLLANDMAEKAEDGYFLPFVEANSGSETASTQRWRDWKKRSVLMLDSNKFPTNRQQTTNATPTHRQRTANAEKEIEKEIDIYTPQTPHGGQRMNEGNGEGMTEQERHEQRIKLERLVNTL